MRNGNGRSEWNGSGAGPTEAETDGDAFDRDPATRTAEPPATLGSLEPRAHSGAAMQLLVGPALEIVFPGMRCTPLFRPPRREQSLDPFSLARMNRRDCGWQHLAFGVSEVRSMNDSSRTPTPHDCGHREIGRDHCSNPGVLTCTGCGVTRCADPYHAYLQFCTLRAGQPFSTQGSKFFYRCDACAAFLCVTCLGIQDDYPCAPDALESHPFVCRHCDGAVRVVRVDNVDMAGVVGAMLSMLDANRAPRTHDAPIANWGAIGNQLERALDAQASSELSEIELGGLLWRHARFLDRNAGAETAQWERTLITRDLEVQNLVRSLLCAEDQLCIDRRSMRGVTLTGENLSVGNLSSMRLVECRFEHCRIVNAMAVRVAANGNAWQQVVLDHSDLSDSLFEGDRFAECSFEQTDLQNATFSGCSFDRIALQRARCENTIFERCEFRGCPEGVDQRLPGCRFVACCFFDQRGAVLP